MALADKAASAGFKAVAKRLRRASKAEHPNFAAWYAAYPPLKGPLRKALNQLEKESVKPKTSRPSFFSKVVKPRVKPSGGPRARRVAKPEDVEQTFRMTKSGKKPRFGTDKRHG